MLDLGQVVEVINVLLPYVSGVVGIGIGLAVVLTLTGAVMRFLRRD